MKYHYSEKGSHEMGYVKIESIQIAQVLKPSTRDMYTKGSNMETAEQFPFYIHNKFFQSQ